MLILLAVALLLLVTMGLFVFRENRLRHIYVEDHEACLGRVASERDVAKSREATLREGLAEVARIGEESDTICARMQAMIDQAHVTLGKVTPQVHLDKDA